MSAEVLKMLGSNPKVLAEMVDKLQRSEAMWARRVEAMHALALEGKNGPIRDVEKRAKQAARER